MNVAEALAHAAGQLPVDGRREAEILLAHVLGRSRTFLYTWPEHVLTPTEDTRFRELVSRRAGGEPVAHLVGSREFWSLDLRVTPATLIPRPETEVLVELALGFIPQEAEWRIADLGTGSGAIALAIAAERPRCTVIATDRSPAALAVARDNAVHLNLRNVEFREGVWFKALSGQRFHLIASNPPYIAEHDPHLAQGDVRFEPRGALVAGADGLTDLRMISSGAGDHLLPDGRLLLEHGYDQGDAVRALLAEAGFIDIQSVRDGLGHERVTLGRRP